MARVIKQSLKRVEFTSLKRLKDAKINFEGYEVTGIFGPNGCGKSTILHSLACIYRPLDGKGEKNYFTRFFKSEKNQNWKNSYLRAFFEIDGQIVDRVYKKGGDHWSPRLGKRLERTVKYIGIGTCVPDVEKEPLSRTRCYLTPAATLENVDEIISAAKRCLRHEYDDYHLEKFASRKYKRVNTKDGRSYSSLAMGAGEQRLFSILQELYALPPYSMLLIDEIDLTLHTLALQELITIMTEVAKKRHLQIIFTSHREEIAYRKDINVRHIWYSQADERTYVLQQTTAKCLSHLTGMMSKTHEVYVEDDLSEAIVRQVLRQENMLPYVEIIRFGDASNAFVLAASNAIRANDKKCLILLDGDVYRTEEAKMEMIKKYYGGTETNKVEQRRKALSYIKQYVLPEGESPEHYLWLQLKQATGMWGNYAKELIEVNEDQHMYFYRIQTASGESRACFLYEVINDLCKLSFWDGYVAELKQWLAENR